MIRYGPEPVFWLLPGCLAVVLVIFVALGIAGSVDPGVWITGILLAVFGILVSLACQSWIELSEEGVRRRSLLGSRLFRWNEIRSVKGRQANPGEGYTDVLIQQVLDRSGYVLFRIGPGTSRRHDLARRIRERIRASRSSSSPGSRMP